MTPERSDEVRWSCDRNAIRFYHKNGSQVNAHWFLLNPFLSPKSSAWGRIVNFFRDIRAGIRLMRTGT